MAKSMELVALVYGLKGKFPREELFGLTPQVRSAVVSVPSNIARGQGRDSTKDFIRYLSIAYGSLMETETQILIAEMREYVSSDNYRNVLEKSADVGSLVNGLSRSLVKKLDACD